MLPATSQQSRDLSGSLSEHQMARDVAGFDREATGCTFGVMEGSR